MELFSVETAPYVRQAVCRMITCNCKTQDFLPLAHVQFDDGVSMACRRLAEQTSISWSPPSGSTVSATGTSC